MSATPPSRCCEPCDRFLRGEINIISQDKAWVSFEHHRDFQSFDTALRLPCAICSLAWTYAARRPSSDNWVELLGTYSCYSPSLVCTLYFHTERNEQLKYTSDYLTFERWPSKWTPPAANKSQHLSSPYSANIRSPVIQHGLQYCHRFSSSQL
jgi:hypothetical protein